MFCYSFKTSILSSLIFWEMRVWKRNWFQSAVSVFRPVFKTKPLPENKWSELRCGVSGREWIAYVLAQDGQGSAVAAPGLSFEVRSNGRRCSILSFCEVPPRSDLLLAWRCFCVENRRPVLRCLLARGLWARPTLERGVSSGGLCICLTWHPGSRLCQRAGRAKNEQQKVNWSLIWAC